MFHPRERSSGSSPIYLTVVVSYSVGLQPERKRKLLTIVRRENQKEKKRQMIRGALLGIIWMIYCVCASFQQETTFVFNGFDQGDHRIHLQDGARIIPKKDVLQLTNATTTQIGRAFFEQPIEFKPSEPVSFSTHFVCALVPVSEVSSHGMAFFVSHSTDFEGAQPSRYLGLFNANGSSSTRVLAVELDIAKAEDVLDISDNHVGVDVNSAVSVVAAPASYFSDKEGRKIDMKLVSGDPIQVWVDYEGTTLNVSLAPLGNQKPSRPLLSSTSINLTEIVQGRRMFVGFSGSTGSGVVNQYLLGWSFSKSMASLQKIDISKLPKAPHPSSKSNYTYLVFDVLLGLLVFLVLGLLFGAYMYRRNLYAEVREDWENVYGPLRYSYKSLYKATNGFSKNEFIGRGGFGEVYKGTLPRSIEMREVAVKKVSHDGEQGMKQFVAEIVCMKSLKHRSLVPLLGYCRRKHELLLVSEYMPNGSLDDYLFNPDNPALPWWRRFAILKDISLALNYLHTEADQVVIHRDIKASNVLLDAELNGRLGDFGMSRLYERGTDPTTTAAVGTVGYMAPELTTFGASTVTDVYAFGVFLLEVTCGRRPVELRVPVEKRFLIKWVCECWRGSSLIDAIDPRLTEFSSREVKRVLKIGLLCANLAPDARPSMEQVVQYLNGNLALPEFWPYSPGIGALTPTTLSPEQLSLESVSLSSSLCNTSMFITHTVLYGSGR